MGDTARAETERSKEIGAHLIPQAPRESQAPQATQLTQQEQGTHPDVGDPAPPRPDTLGAHTGATEPIPKQTETDNIDSAWFAPPVQPAFAPLTPEQTTRAAELISHATIGGRSAPSPPLPPTAQSSYQPFTLEQIGLASSANQNTRDQNTAVSHLTQGTQYDAQARQIRGAHKLPEPDALSPTPPNSVFTFHKGAEPPRSQTDEYDARGETSHAQRPSKRRRAGSPEQTDTPLTPARTTFHSLGATQTVAATQSTQASQDPPPPDIEIDPAEDTDDDNWVDDSRVIDDHASTQSLIAQALAIVQESVKGKTWRLGKDKTLRVTDLLTKASKQERERQDRLTAPPTTPRRHNTPDSIVRARDRPQHLGSACHLAVLRVAFGRAATYLAVSSNQFISSP